MRINSYDILNNRIHDSFSSRCTIRVWEISVRQLDLRTFDQFGRGTNCGGLVFV